MAVVETHPGISGKDFLTAAVAGYEIGPRVGICMTPEHIAQGWHSAATVGVFAAASAAARALKLDIDKTVHALGIAGTQASGLMAAQYGAMVKRMHAGRASQSGFYGALLADQGFTGITNVFESEYGGFCTTFSRSQDRFKMNELTAGLGSKWETFNDSLKFYSCVFSNHNALDAIREIQAERPFKATDVEKVVVHGAQITVDHVGWKYKPEGMTSAQLNMPFCIATFLLEGDVFVDQFNEEVINDPQRMALADRIEVLNDPAITAGGTPERFTLRVEIFFKDGTKMERTGKTERANEHNFPPEQAVLEKFEKLTRHLLPQKQRRELRDAVLGLEQLDDAARLATLLKCA
jgi:2-methylcitrate dehydratase PrpD